MTGRPPKKVTQAQRDKVKLLKAAGWSNERIAAQIGMARNTLEDKFRAEIDFGADMEEAELLASAKAAAKKKNVAAIKWLAEKFATAGAAQRLVGRERPAPPAKAPKLGKNEERQRAAEKVGGKFAPPPPPKLH